MTPIFTGPCADIEIEISNLEFQLQQLQQELANSHLPSTEKSLIAHQITETESSIATANAQLNACVESNFTLVVVSDDTETGVGGAEVFVNGSLVGTTSGSGALRIPKVNLNDEIAARLLVYENPTDRGNHNSNAGQNWSFRAYITSVPVVYDTTGDTVELPVFKVTNPAGPQDVVISKNNTVIGLNLVVSVEWDATSDELTQYKDRFLETSEVFFNGTDGQFLIEELLICGNSLNWDNADIRVYASDVQRSLVTSVNGLSKGTGCIEMNPWDLFYPGVLYHEMGHYVLGLYDEYLDGDICTLASNNSGTIYSNGGAKDSCPMRGAQNFPLKKYCSTHPDNPHVPGPLQVIDCWSTIVKNFNNSLWKLHTPQSRGLLLGRLKDLAPNLPLYTVTVAPSDAGQQDNGAIGSYFPSLIPILGWKPQWTIETPDLPADLPYSYLKLLVLRDGQPTDGVEVALIDATGRSIYQGITQPFSLNENINVSAGEIFILGAHLGDTIEASIEIPTEILFDELTVNELWFCNHYITSFESGLLVIGLVKSGSDL